MAYIIGVLTPDEQRDLEARGWEFQRAKWVVKELYSPETGQPCPDCDRGKIVAKGDDEVCCDDCLKTWVNRDQMYGCYVDNDVHKIMTGPDWQKGDD